MRKSLALLTFMLFASAAHAEPPRAVDEAEVKALVEKVMLTPRAKADAKRSKFSRARPIPLERRVRVLSRESELDARGAEFVRFAIDQRSPFDDVDEWQEGRMVGCVYLSARKVFVQRGSGYVLISNRTGTDGKVQPGACTSAAQASAPSSAQAPGQRS
jgi:hypothetical protein